MFLVVLGFEIFAVLQRVEFLLYVGELVRVGFVLFRLRFEVVALLL